MKGEEEFLKGMWQKVSALEKDEIEKAHIKNYNKRLTIKAMKVAVVSSMVFIALVFLSPNIKDSIYPLTICILFMSFMYEGISNKILEDKTYGD